MSRHARRLAVVVSATALLLPVAALPAAAHVTANPDEADSQYFRTALRISHGCEGSPTTAVRVQIPEGVDSPKAEVVPGWEIETVREELDEPVDDGHGGEITERVTEVGWHSGSLSDEHFQDLGLSFRITDEAPEVIWLPTIQECEEGEHRWIDIPDTLDEWGALDEPAPYVQVVSGDATAADSITDSTDVASPEPEETAAEADEAEQTAQAAESGTDPLAVSALVVAVLGLLAAIGAVFYARRRS